MEKKERGSVYKKFQVHQKVAVCQLIDPDQTGEKNMKVADALIRLGLPKVAAGTSSGWLNDWRIGKLKPVYAASQAFRQSKGKFEDVEHRLVDVIMPC